MYVTKEKLEELKKSAAEEVGKAKAVIAEHGEDPARWPADAKTEYNDALAKGRDFIEKIKTAQADRNIIDAAKQLADEIGAPGEPSADAGKVKTGQQLAFKSMAPAVVKSIGLGVDGVKALAPSGSTVVGQDFDQSPIELGRPANSLLSILPTRVRSWQSFKIAPR